MINLIYAMYRLTIYQAYFNIIKQIDSQSTNNNSLTVNGLTVLFDVV